MFTVLPIRATLSGLRATQRRLLPSIVLTLALSCAWGAREAYVPPPDPTLAPQPTFTSTPLPPTSTPAPTATPVSPAGAVNAQPSTQMPTDTPSPATDTPTPTPTDTPIPPTPTPAPPTATPVPPTPTPVPPTPTPTPVPTTTPTPAPRFDLGTWWKENNCYDLGVYGLIFDSEGEGLSGITVEVVGGDKTFTATSASDGSYNLHLGSLLDFEDDTAWSVQLKDGGQIVSDTVNWNTSRDCDDENKIQVLRLEWKREQ